MKAWVLCSSDTCDLEKATGSGEESAGDTTEGSVMGSTCRVVQPSDPGALARAADARVGSVIGSACRVPPALGLGALEGTIGTWDGSVERSVEGSTECKFESAFGWLASESSRTSDRSADTGMER